MTSKKSNIHQVLLALIFAGAIIFSSFLLKDTQHASTMMYLLIALWFASSNIKAQCKSEKKVNQQ